MSGDVYERFCAFAAPAWARGKRADVDAFVAKLRAELAERDAAAERGRAQNQARKARRP
jgi:hypothetical protein